MKSITKREYFLYAVASGSLEHKAWVIRAFSKTEGMAKEHPTEHYPWPLFLRDGSMWTENPNYHEAILIRDAPADGRPLLTFMEDLHLEKGDLLNVEHPLDTCYGNALVNQTLLVYPFGDKIPFQTGPLKVSGLEKMIEGRLEDTPPPGAKRDPAKLYVDEYKKFNEAMRYLEGFTQLCVPSATPKTMTIDPAIIKRRDELYKEYKDRLDDPIIQARIADELVKMDKASMKGDPAERFFIKDKSYDVVRKKLFIMQGQTDAFGKTGEFIGSSLQEGWSVEHIPTMANSQRAGSYSRGFLTALGGVEAKGNYRIFQNTVVAEPDCGSTLGLRITLGKKEIDDFISYSVINTDGSLTEITDANKSEFIDKPIVLRSVAYCKTEGHNVCAVCVGKKIAATPNAVSTFAAEIGNYFMQILLAAAHTVALKTTKVDYLESLT